VATSNTSSISGSFSDGPDLPLESVAHFLHRERDVLVGPAISTWPFQLGFSPSVFGIWMTFVIGRIAADGDGGLHRALWAAERFTARRMASPDRFRKSTIAFR